MKMQQGIKQLADILISISELFFLSPNLLINAITTKLDSPGKLSFHIFAPVKTGNHSMYICFVESSVDVTNMITLWNINWEKWLGK